MERRLEMMQRRHKYFTKLIGDNGIRSARDFYEKLKDHFDLYGVVVDMDTDKCCRIELTLPCNDYEEYRVIEEKGLFGTKVIVSPTVAFQDDTCVNTEMNIFKEAVPNFHGNPLVKF